MENVWSFYENFNKKTTLGAQLQPDSQQVIIWTIDVFINT